MKFSPKIKSNAKLFQVKNILLVAALAAPIVYALLTGELASLIHIIMSRSDIEVVSAYAGGGSAGGIGS
ncbi:hypothetical protein [Stygiolobus caldivivus]|uniref:Uncharacterized protein n=1 Tax=Stygiolobus caldivivus TaxID=2824673 RepID=A0A8D5ZIV7_9CREN|nr:hypothetical protein [Stygiolobus caldivivus]BCU69617.1 hypothetical protein KN1_09140 [Stygiolobus caldivivus]